MLRWEYLCQVVRTMDDGMGGTISVNNNLYVTDFNILQRTDDGQYPVYEFWAAEVNPRTADIDHITGDPILYTGLQKLYDNNSLATTGAGAGSAVGNVNDSMNLFTGVKDKVSLIVPTTPGDEIVFVPE